MLSIKFSTVTMMIAFFIGVVAFMPANTLAGGAAKMAEEGAKAAEKAVKGADEKAQKGAAESGIHAGSAPTGESEKMSGQEKAEKIKKELKETSEEIKDTLKK